LALAAGLALAEATFLTGLVALVGFARLIYLPYSKGQTYSLTYPILPRPTPIAAHFLPLRRSDGTIPDDPPLVRW
jgi:hypothetical protein